MSYEGYQEYLCKKGHYSARDCYEPKLVVCPECGGQLEYWNSVDQTNGCEEDNPGTYPADKLVFDTEFCYKPNSSRWRKIK